jgi:hypothetical protein
MLGSFMKDTYSSFIANLLIVFEIDFLIMVGHYREVHICSTQHNTGISVNTSKIPYSLSTFAPEGLNFTSQHYLRPVHEFCGLSWERSETGAVFYCMNEQDCCLKTVVIMGREKSRY